MEDIEKNRIGSLKNLINIRQHALFQMVDDGRVVEPWLRITELEIAELKGMERLAGYLLEGRGDHDIRHLFEDIRLSSMGERDIKNAQPNIDVIKQEGTE